MPVEPIRGPRGRLVYLRPLEPEDAELADRWYADERVRTMMGDLPVSLARRRQRDADAVTGDREDVLRFVICTLENDEPVGRLDVFDIDRRNGSAMFGITIGEPRRWGHGLGTDALNALTDFVFGELRLERLALDTDAGNLRAQAAYRRAGFVEEGRLRHAWFGEGRYGDLVIMALLRDEWLALDRPRSWELVAEAEREAAAARDAGAARGGEGERMAATG